MKKTIILAIVIPIASVVVAAAVAVTVFFTVIDPPLGPGKTDHVKMTVGESKYFTQAEIKSAMDCVLVYFRDHHKGSVMTDLWYDEATAKVVCKYNGYALDGKTIVFYSSSYAENPENAGDMDSDWGWVLQRDSKTSPWHVTGEGFL